MTQRTAASFLIRVEAADDGRREGTVTSVQSLGFDARCRAGDGTRRFVQARWRLTRGNDFAGTLRVRS